MIRGNTSARFELIHTILKTKRNVVSITDLCELAGVSRSGYYRWVRAEGTRKRREAQDKADFQLILRAYRFRGYDKGAQGIKMRLLRMQVLMNVKKIRRLMKKYDLHCPIRKPNPRKQMMRDLRTDVVFDNLVKREFKEHGPRKILLTDITYIRLREDFVYLSVIIDAYTMQVLSYRLSDSLKVDFVLETVRDLIAVHGISLDEDTCIHSDQGCHYTSVKFRELVENSALRQSMSAKGNCWDNAPQESFFGHMKDELAPYMVGWETIDDVMWRIHDWMDYYNNDRYQIGLKELSPNEYYEYCVTGKNPLEGVRERLRSGNGVKGQYAGRNRGRAALDEVTRETLSSEVQAV